MGENTNFETVDRKNRSSGRDKLRELLDLILQRRRADNQI